MKHAARGLFWAALTLLIVYTLTSSFNVRYAKAWSGDITINSDGSIDPPTAPVSHSGNRYSLTDNVQGSIVVEKDNIIVDGMGHTVQGTGASTIGLSLSQRANVVIMRMGIENFLYGVYLDSSSHNVISQANITGNSDGIYLTGSSDNVIYGNTVASGTYEGIYLSYSSNNIIFGNTITGNGFDGVYLGSSSNNKVLGNLLTANTLGVFLDSSSGNNVLGNNITNNSEEAIFSSLSSNNGIYHNNLMNNTEQADSASSTDVWDNGYPSGGNYWSNYTGQDINNDGLGDIPYVIDGNNSDRYPLMKPWLHIRGDTNYDGRVTLADLVILANAYGTQAGHDPPGTGLHQWNPNADIDNNGVVGLSDLVTLAVHYGQHFP